MTDDLPKEPMWQRYRRLVRPRLNEELTDELEFHLQMRIEEYVREGMTPDAAQREAQARFGDLESVERECKALDRRLGARERRTERLGQLRLDLRFALRGMLRRPGFSAIAVLTLALGIGATTLLFGIVNAVLLRPLGYDRADRAIVIWNSFQDPAIPKAALSAQDAADLAAGLRGVETISAFTDWTANLTGAGDPARLQGYQVSPSFFSTLGVAPLAGRFFQELDGRVGSDRVVVLSRDLWRSRFGGEPAVVGRAIQINGEPYTVVGVAPEGFRFPDAPGFLFPEHADLWVPHDWLRDLSLPRGVRMLRVIARLPAGTAVDQARRLLESSAAAMREQYPGEYPPRSGWRPYAVPLRNQVLGETQPALLVLAGAGTLLLLVACANVANLLLARGSARSREMALRGAIGASKVRLAGQLFTENLMLALAGGLVGLGVAVGGSALVRAYGPRSIPRIETVSLDGRVVAFGLGLCIVAAMVSGLGPILQQGRRGARDLLRGDGRGVVGVSGASLRMALVVAEVALSLIVLVGAGLLVKSFVRLQTTEVGFAPTGVLTAQVTLSPAGYPTPEAQAAFFGALLGALSQQPGVRGAGGADPLPLSGDSWSGSFAVAGLAPDDQRPSAEISLATPGLFEALSIRMKAGRTFGPGDDPRSPAVVIVDSLLAARYWPGGNAVGQRLRSVGGADTSGMEIVGVAAHVRKSGARDEERPQIYRPWFQAPRDRMSLALRGDGSAAQLLPGLRQAVHQLDPAQPIARIAPMEELVARATAMDRFALLLLGSFALAATLLAAIGLYGVMSYTVSQRTREMGVRLALGARRGQLVRLVILEGMKPALAGLLAGVAVSMAIGRLMRGLLYQIGAIDPGTYLVAFGFLGGMALLACAIPARRAARVDPVLSLRSD